MPAAQRYDTPSEQLYALAHRARVREWTFEKFWERAVPPPRMFESGNTWHVRYDDGGVPVASRRLPRVSDADPPKDAVLWPTDTADRRLAYAAVLDAEIFWRAAFEGRAASPAERALGRLNGLGG